MTSLGSLTAEAILDAMPDGCVVVGEDRCVTFLNPRAARLLGVDPDEVRGRPVGEVVPLVDSTGHDWWTTINPWGGLRTRTGHREVMLRLRGNGEVLVTMSFVRAGRLGPVQRVIVVLRDTDQRRRAELDTAELLSIAAHELRSPLSSVRGFSGTLVRQWARFNDDQRKLMVETIHADSERLSRLLNELLDVSRLTARRLRVSARPLDLRQAIGACVDRLVAGGHDRSRFAWAEADLPAQEVWADADRLDQILTNLLDNALRHGAGTVSIRTLDVPAPTVATADTPYVAAEVFDEGEGIDPELYPLIFEKFWHGSDRGSTGLGLYLVKGLAEAHGGRVDVDRASGGGALFRVALPRRQPASFR